MQVGDLVTMDHSDWAEGDEWGVGIIVKFSPKTPKYCEIHWSKLGALSWEMREMLVRLNASRRSSDN